VARFLIIGCGCRGRHLAGELIAAGHAVRGTTRDGTAVSELQAAGVEAFVGDPDRVATLTPALDHVSAAVILLGSAVGSGDELAALHGTRLEMLLTKILDTTVRAVVYESAGSVPAEILAGGTERVRAVCEDSRIPFALLQGDPADAEAWLREASASARQVLMA
jgi:nucleoside-diphosphate-sugar epimerase